MPQAVGVVEASMAIIEALRERGATEVEFGYDPLNGAERALPGEQVRWWATMRSKGTIYSGECVTDNHAEGPVLALARCAARAGMRVRVRFEGGA